MNAEEIKQIRRLCLEVTPGPWIDADGIVFDGTELNRHIAYAASGGVESVEREVENLSFIAQSREWIPKLCREVERLQKERDEWKRKYEIADNNGAVMAEEADEWKAEAGELEWEIRQHQIRADKDTRLMAESGAEIERLREENERLKQAMEEAIYSANVGKNVPSVDSHPAQILRKALEAEEWER